MPNARENAQHLIEHYSKELGVSFRPHANILEKLSGVPAISPNQMIAALRGATKADPEPPKPTAPKPTAPKLVVAVDFDGTCVTHEFPEVGQDCPHAVDVLRNLVASGAGLVLFTMRSGEYLDAAVKWFSDREIPLYGVQFNPTQANWTQSNKCYAQVYIDDAALGCPLIHDATLCKRPFVDWVEVDKLIGKYL